MKKIYFLLLLSTAIVFAAQAATVTGLDPNGDGFLSLRKKPHQREIGKLYNGDKVEILSKSGKYYKVKDVKSGMIGYAHSNWIRKTSNSTTASTSTSQKKGTVHGLDPNGDGFLAVRTKPKGKKIGKLYNGDKVAILGQRGAWYKVRTSSGLVGWSHGDWIQKTYHSSSPIEYADSLQSIKNQMIGRCYKHQTADIYNKKKYCECRVNGTIKVYKTISNYNQKVAKVGILGMKKFPEYNKVSEIWFYCVNDDDIEKYEKQNRE